MNGGRGRGVWSLSTLLLSVYSQPGRDFIESEGKTHLRVRFRLLGIDFRCMQILKYAGNEFVSVGPPHVPNEWINVLFYLAINPNAIYRPALTTTWTWWSF